MTISRIAQYPYPDGSLDTWANKLHSTLTAESTARIRDFDIFKLSNVAWDDADQYSTLAVAISHISSTEKTLIIASQQDVTADMTIPSTLTLKFLQGGTLNITAAKTVTINQQPDAGLYQIFEGAGSVVFGAGAVKEVHPQWWGVTNDGVLTTTTMQKALGAWEASDLRGEFYLSEGTYLIGACTVTAPSNRLSAHLRGAGKSTVIKASGAVDLFTVNMGASNFQEFTWDGISFDMDANDARAIVTAGTSGSKATIQNVWITDTAAASTKALIDLAANTHVADLINVNILGHSNKVGTGISINCNTVNVWRCNIQQMDEAISFAANNITNINIIGNRLDNNNYGVKCDTLAIISIVIEGNRFESNAEYGVFLKGYNSTTSRIFSVSISKNYFTGIPNAKFGIGVQRIDGLIIEGNRFDGVAGAINITWISTISNVSLKANVVGASGMAVTMTGGLNEFLINDVTLTQTSLPRSNIIAADNSSIATSGTGEDDLRTRTVVAYTVGATGGLEVMAAGTKTGANDNKTIKLHFGTDNWTVFPAANDIEDWILIARIYNTATNAQRIFWQLSGATGVVASGFETGTQDTTASVTLKITGECAHADDTITQAMWHIEGI